MAGERFTKLTIEARLSANAGYRADQTFHLRFQLGGVWVDYYRGAYAQQHQFVVPDPADVGRDYVKQAVENLLALVKLDIQSRGLPYVVSATRDLGNDTNTGVPRIAFDIEATEYLALLDLDFDNLYTIAPTGWTVVQRLTTLGPLSLTASVQPAVVYGTPTGSITVYPFGGNTRPLTYTWADDATATGATRLSLRAGTYTVVVADHDGVSVTGTYEVKSDPQLLVSVQQTERSLTLVVSGGVAPYSVAWDDGPTTLARAGLAPGTYQATVTDAHGAQVRLSATLLANHCYFSHNPVRLALDAGAAYRLDRTSKANLSFVAEVWVEPVYLSGEYEQAGPQLEQPADAGGRTVFDVQALLDAYVQEHLPALGGPLASRAEGLFKRFYLKSAEKYGTPPVPAALTTAQVHFVLCGGLSPAEAAAGRWPAYQAAVQPFLTWEPDYQRVLPAQPVYLYYQHVAADGDVVLWRKVRRRDGTTTDAEVATLAGVRRWEVHCLAVGPGPLGLAGADVAGYDVWLATAAGEARSQVRHYVLEHAYYPLQRFLLYSNSLGGVNSLAALGQAKQTLAVQADEAARPAYDPDLGDVAVLDRPATGTLSLTTGPRRRAQVYADQELLTSLRVVLVKDGRYWPGRVAAATYTVRDEAEGLAALSFDFVLPTQRHFSPALPAAVVGQVVTPVAGGEGPTP